ncbi:hypothetical protein ACIBF5_09685 [Micromonospora sp. NPDC050417]|uniref:hypothetical protein n=1 Tax=Micromonospora sp. NPDC050417 TaxID=3364280 RepID=UPI0037B40DE5
MTEDLTASVAAVGALDDPLALLTVADLARLCQTGEDWIRKACAARSVRWTRAGGQIRFTRRQAEDLIASQLVDVAHVPTRDQAADKRARVA